jgi:hypothetical protein
MNQEIQPDEEILTFFKTLVDADRLRIAGLLGVEALSPLQLAERLHLSPMKVVNHLGRLEEAGFVTFDGHLYSLDDKGLESMARRNLQSLRPKPKIEAFDGEAYDRKVVKDFMGTDGRFKSLPMHDKKFLSVLRYVLEAFEPGVEYTEKQVNEMLQRYHPDTASLRRGLVDAGMVTRWRGIYQRPAEKSQ